MTNELVKQFKTLQDYFEQIKKYREEGNFSQVRKLYKQLDDKGKATCIQYFVDANDQSTLAKLYYGV
jgi:hypothetical protein